MPCLAARLVRNVTIPNGEILPPSLPFTKIWRIQNVGSCTWDTSVQMVPVSGDSMGGTRFHISSKVKPGKTVEIAASLMSPAINGGYTGYWKLQYKSQKFGDGNNPFKVRINVVTGAHGTIFNFAEDCSEATWNSNATERNLPCPGKPGARIGFVVRLNQPDMENGSFAQWGIWTHPPLRDGGEIWGAYPALIIQPGDRFMAELACLYNYTQCNVSFDLYYQIVGASDKVLLGHWVEVYDNVTTMVDIDLSALVNQYITFFLKVTGHGQHSEHNAAFWFMPRIHRP